jgi:hypothetical protein
MATVTQILFLGMGVFGAGSWIAACSTGNDGTDQTRDAGMDTSEVGSADGTFDSGVEAASPDVGSDVMSNADASDGRVPCTVSNCGGTCCGDRCILDLTCAGCSEGTFFCPYSFTVPFSNGKCVSSCSACDTVQADAAVACYSCGPGTTPVSCAATAAQCPTSGSAGACACSAGDGGCPGATQVCMGESDADPGICLSCGQSGTDGLPCGGGKTCTEATSTCQ